MSGIWLVRRNDLNSAPSRIQWGGSKELVARDDSLRGGVAAGRLQMQQESGEMFEVMLIVGGTFLFVILGAAMAASVRRHFIQPSSDAYIQSRWEEHRELQHQALNGRLWRFIAKLLFWLAVGEALAIWYMAAQLGWM